MAILRLQAVEHAREGILDHDPHADPGLLRALHGFTATIRTGPGGEQAGVEQVSRNQSSPFPTIAPKSRVNRWSGRWPRIARFTRAVKIRSKSRSTDAASR